MCSLSGLLWVSMCATILSTHVAVAVPNSKVLVLHQGLNCRTRIVFSRPTNENVTTILFGVSKYNEFTLDTQRLFTASFNHDEVGITRPIVVVGDDSFPSCQGYTKKSKKNSKFCRTLGDGVDHQNNAAATTISGHTTVDGWRVLRYHKRVGYGNRCYRRVQTAMVDWDFEARHGNTSLGIISSTLQSKNDFHVRSKIMKKASSTTKKLLATFTEMRFPGPLKPIYVVNPVHAVYEIVDSRQSPNSLFSSVAYATLSGHLLAGEERVTVRKGERDEVEILSFSRSTSSFIGKCIWPMIGRLQQKFFRSELYHLDKIAKC